MLRTLSKLPQGSEIDSSGYKGFFYHFLDMQTGRRANQCELSTIDTALFMAGALSSAGFFDRGSGHEKEIRHLVGQLYERVDWRWALNGEATLCMAWKPERGFTKSRWDQGYTEAMILYVLALGSPTHPISPKGYHQEQQMKTTEIVVERKISASPSQIYEAWLDTKNPGGPWFGTAKAIVNPKLDGLFYHSVHFEGNDWSHYGRFVTLERGIKLQHTWVSEATKGLETMVTITFEASGDQTLVKLCQTNVPDDEMGRKHQEGWGYVLGALAERFSS
jgi:uncharacterized protein YndB with AHSA1/START domain